MTCTHYTNLVLVSYDLLRLYYYLHKNNSCEQMVACDCHLVEVIKHQSSGSCAHLALAVYITDYNGSKCNLK